MKSRDELVGEVEVLGEPIAAVSAAVLHLGFSVGLATVLQEAVDSARTLTNARYSIIVSVDEAGEAREFVTSGREPEEHLELAERPDGPKLFAHLRDLPGSFRLADLPGRPLARGRSPRPRCRGRLPRDRRPLPRPAYGGRPSSSSRAACLRG